MTAKIIPFPVTRRHADRLDHSLLFEAAPFMSMCPTCRANRSQLGYSARTLVRLLDRNRPIEAYCAICSQSWTIDTRERTRLAEELDHLRLS